jgi:PAS domain S-box-containing protein
LRLGYGVVVVLLLVYAGSVALRGGRTYVPWLDQGLTTVIQLSASTLCMIRAFTTTRSRLAARALASGLLVWSLGDVVWQLQSGGGAVPVPSASDALFLAFYPLVFVAVVGIIRTHAPGVVIGSWLDGLLTALGTASLCAAFGFGGILELSGANRAEILVNLTYPLGDLVLLAMSVGALSLLPDRDRQGLLLLTGGLLFACSDSTYLFQSAANTYTQGSWIDLGWPAAIVVLSFAAWPIGRVSDSLAPGRYRRRAALPLGAFAIGTGVLVYGDVDPVGLLAPALAAIMLLVALARIVIVLRDLRGLELERSLRAQAEAAHEKLSQQEAQNRALVARLAGLLDAAPVGIIEGDLDGLITRWNPAAERIYGWTEAEARGTPVPRGDRSQDIVSGTSTPRPGTPVKGVGPPERHRRKDGTTVDVEVAAAELRDDSGQVTGWIRVVNDVSRRIELEVLLRHAQKMESIGHLASGCRP